MKFILTYLVLSTLLSGCGEKRDQNVKEAEVILKEAEELLSELQSNKDFSQDYNFDGVADVYYEDFKHNYVQFVDRNFDGKADEKYEFDTNTDFLLNGRLDNDFDGIFETQLSMYHGVIQFELVDSNGDGLIDIVSSYENGVLKELQKYKSKQIEVYLFEHGVPYSSNTRTTKLSDRGFHQKQTEKIKAQKMYKDNYDK